MRTLRLLAFGVAACLLLAGTPLLAANAHANLPQPASVFVHGSVDACTNNPGPYITLDGDLLFGGVDARLIFRNNTKGTHENEEDVTGDISLLPGGDVIRFNKQPSRGGVGGNPWIYLQFNDAAGNTISDEVLLGRCVQGLDPTGLDFLMDTLVDLEVTGGDCSGQGGPNINVTGELTLGGLGATITFANNQKGTHQHDEDVTIEITLLEPGETITFAKSPHLGGAGGNPLVYLQFLDGDGNPYGSEIFLARCNKLGDDGKQKKRGRR